MACVRRLFDGHTWHLGKWDSDPIPNPFFFSGAGHSPPCPESVPLALSSCWICSAQCFFVNTDKQLPVALMSIRLPRDSAGGALPGSPFNCPLSPGPNALCCHMLAPRWPEGAILQRLLLQPGLQLLALWASLCQTKQAEHESCKIIPAVFCFHRRKL